MILAADVGGTKVNMALFDAARPSRDGRGGAALVARATFASADHPGLEPIVGAFLERQALPAGSIRAACFGVAGPVLDERCETPNLPWRLDGRRLARRFEIASVALVNDLVATAEGIPSLLPAELVTLQRGREGAAGPPRAGALIAAGTGLGMATLIPDGAGQWRAWPSEGGHADFSPRDAEEAALLRFMLRRYPDHVSVERLVSGPGLEPIYEHLLERDGGDEQAAVRAAIDDAEADAPRVISEHGVDGRCARCARTVRLFARLYGAAAGNLALVAVALGGIYVGGGVAPKILDLLAEGGFIESFRSKGRMSELMSQIPIHVITNADAALLGAARCAARLVDAAA